MEELNNKQELQRDENGFIMVKVKPLIDWKEPNGEGCIVSDKITKEGWKVGYMFREEPVAGQPDSGWCFLKGDESEEYMNDSNNHHIFALNTLCNYDSEVIPHLNSPISTSFIRTEGGKFAIDDGTQPIVFEKQGENKAL